MALLLLTDTPAFYRAQQLIALIGRGSFTADLYDIGFLVVGFIVLIAVILPRLLSDQKMITAPLVYMAA